MPDTLDTVAPGWEYGEDTDLGVVVSDYQSALLADQNFQVSRRRWTLVYQNLTTAEEAIVLGVIEDAKTGDGTTTFTPRGAGSPVTVRVVDRVIHFTNSGPNKRSGQIQVQEVL